MATPQEEALRRLRAEEGDDRDEGPEIAPAVESGDDVPVDVHRDIESEGSGGGEPLRADEPSLAPPTPRPTMMPPPPPPMDGSSMEDRIAAMRAELDEGVSSVRRDVVELANHSAELARLERELEEERKRREEERRLNREFLDRAAGRSSASTTTEEEPPTAEAPPARPEPTPEETRVRELADEEARREAAEPAPVPAPRREGTIRSWLSRYGR